MGVDLGGREAGVPEQLLHASQVGAAPQELGRVSVPHGMRRYGGVQAGLAHTTLECRAQRVRAHPVAARRAQQSVRVRLPLASELGAGKGEVGPRGVERRLVDGHDALLRALPHEPHLPLGEVDVGHVEPRELRDPRARGIEELEHRPVTEADAVMDVAYGDQRGRLLVGEHAGKELRELRAGDRGGAVLAGEALVHEPLVEPAYGRQPPRDRLGRVPGLRELAQERPELAMRDLERAHALALAPRGEGAEVAPVGCHGVGREAPDVFQIGQESLDVGAEPRLLGCTGLRPLARVAHGSANPSLAASTKMSGRSAMQAARLPIARSA